MKYQVTLRENKDDRYQFNIILSNEEYTETIHLVPDQSRFVIGGHYVQKSNSASENLYGTDIRARWLSYYDLANYRTGQICTTILSSYITEQQQSDAQWEIGEHVPNDLRFKWAFNHFATKGHSISIDLEPVVIKADATTKKLKF